MSKNRKLSCLFFLNEFINKNVTTDWEESKFESEFITFLEGLKDPYVEIRKTLLKNYELKSGKFNTDLIIGQDEKEQSLWIDKFVYDVNMHICSLYLSFKPKDFLLTNLKKENSPCANFAQFTNNLTRMISWDIVSTKNLSKRAEKLKLYLKIIDRFLKNETGGINLCAAFCILNSFNVTEVSRLKETWNKLYKISSHAKELFEEFSNIFKFENGFKALRNFISEKPDSIPPLFLLTFDKNKFSEFELLNVKFSNNGSLNDSFTKLQERLRSWHFKFPSQTNFQSLLLNAAKISDDELTAQSKLIEPPTEIKVKTVANDMSNIKISNEKPKKTENKEQPNNSSAPVTRMKRSLSDLSLTKNENAQAIAEAKSKAKEKRRSVAIIATHETDDNTTNAYTYLPFRDSKKGKPKKTTNHNLGMEVEESANQKSVMKNNTNSGF